jgi:hypothetical protein
MTTEGLRKGRLSKGEHAYIEQNWKDQTVLDICKHLNRDPLGIITYIRKLGSIGDFDAEGSAEVQTLREYGFSLDQALSFVSTGSRSTLAQIDFNEMVKLVSTLDDLQESILSLKESIESNILDWRTKVEEDVKHQMMARESIISFSAAIQQRALADKHNMPVPPPPICSMDNVREQKLQNVAGVYFAYDENGILVYVGRSKDLHKRLTHHHKIKNHHLVSWLEFEKSKIYTAELFYIWLLEPRLNKEVELASGAFDDDRQLLE